MITFGVNDQIYENCSTPAPIKYKPTFNFPSSKSDFQDCEIKSSKKKTQKNKKVMFQKVRQKYQTDYQTQHEQQSKNSMSQYTMADFNMVGNLKKLQSYESQIIKNIKQLKGVLDLDICSYNLKRIFKASQHNFDVKKFHQLCGHIQNTVVVAQVNNGNIVGGYTPLTWDDDYISAKTHYKTDKECKSFIFNFTSRQKYPLIKQTNNKAIVGCQYIGPTFGGGYDFSIGNFANKKYSSSCDFPTSYSKKTEIKNLKLSRRSLIGISEQLFLLKQWQIFAVCPKQQTIQESIFTIQDKSKKDVQDQQKQEISEVDSGFMKNVLAYFIGNPRFKNHTNQQMKKRVSILQNKQNLDSNNQSGLIKNILQYFVDKTKDKNNQLYLSYNLLFRNIQVKNITVYQIDYVLLLNYQYIAPIESIRYQIYFKFLVEKIDENNKLLKKYFR